MIKRYDITIDALARDTNCGYGYRLFAYSTFDILF